MNCCNSSSALAATAVSSACHKDRNINLSTDTLCPRKFFRYIWNKINNVGISTHPWRTSLPSPLPAPWAKFFREGFSRSYYITSFFASIFLSYVLSAPSVFLSSPPFSIATLNWWHRKLLLCQWRRSLPFPLSSLLNFFSITCYIMYALSIVPLPSLNSLPACVSRKILFFDCLLQPVIYDSHILYAILNKNIYL